ncbi:MAG: hypothetical protein PHY14_00150 [Candidatus Gracilibacteria bacterium]|nr:hypothetical protein [Candidatus Gracilibacteria bacterium]
MTLSTFFVILSSLFYLIGIVPYFYHVFHGRVVPHPFSWTIWFMFAATSGYFVFLTEGFSYSLIPVIIRTTALLIGSLLGWFYIRKIRIGFADYLTLFLAIAIITGTKILGVDGTIVFMIIIDFLVLFPSLKKIWINPASEDIIAWIFAPLSIGFFLLSLRDISFSNAGYFLYQILLNVAVAIFIYKRKLYVSSWKYFFGKGLEFFALRKKFW